MINTIFLMGYMGVGKTIIGKSLSNSIGYKFYDMDDFIEKKEGKTVSQIFKDHNEVYFRRLEHKCLIELSSINEKKIISTGGGTPCFENNLDIINTHPYSLSVYLKANVNTIIERIKNSEINRPMISHLKENNQLNEFIKKHLFERSFYYEKSNIKVKTDNLKITEIVDKICKKLV